MEYWNLARAPFCPYFFRSFILGSRVRNPAWRNRGCSSSSVLTSARAIPSWSAPACPEMPPPDTRALMLNFSRASTHSKGFFMNVMSVSLRKYSSRVPPLTTTSPVPELNRTRATDVFLLPIPAYCMACSTLHEPPDLPFSTPTAAQASAPRDDDRDQHKL